MPDLVFGAESKSEERVFRTGIVHETSSGGQGPSEYSSLQLEAFTEY